MKKMILGLGLVLALGGAAFTVVAMMGVPEQKLPPRGTDEYYISEPLLQELGEVSVNLKSDGPNQYLQVVLAAQYVIGPEIEGGTAAPIFEEKKAMIEDRLNLLLSDKTYEDVKGSDKKMLLKEEIRRILQKVVFHEDKGRVDEVLFRKFYVQ